VLLFLQDDSRDVDLSVYDVQGRRVRQIVSGALNKGAHSLSWSGRDDGSRRVASGVYFYQLRIDGHVRETIRTVVLR
jgi:flagellar hook assembly protein FlgD